MAIYLTTPVQTTRIYLTTPVQTTRIGPYDSHVWDRLMHIARRLTAVEEALRAPLTAAELEAQRFCDCLAAVGVDNAHELLQR